MGKMLFSMLLAALSLACDPPPDLHLSDAGPDADLSDAGMGSDTAPVAWCEREPVCAFTSEDIVNRETTVATCGLRNECGKTCYKCAGRFNGNQEGPIGACQMPGPDYDPTPNASCVRECSDCLEGPACAKYPACAPSVKPRTGELCFRREYDSCARPCFVCDTGPSCRYTTAASGVTVEYTCVSDCSQCL